MTRLMDKEKAMRLRKRGKSYSQIAKNIQVSKGTLSSWLKNLPLTKDRMKMLRDWNPQRIERYRATRQRKKKERLEKLYSKEKSGLLPLSARDILIAGLFLYLGEGTKTTVAQLSLSNTNPAVIKFFIKWLIKTLKVPHEKIKIRLQLYRDMDVNEEINFWSKKLLISKNQFRNPYIKKTDSKKINYLELRN